MAPEPEADATRRWQDRDALGDHRAQGVGPPGALLDVPVKVLAPKSLRDRVGEKLRNDQGRKNEENGPNMRVHTNRERARDQGVPMLGSSS